MEDPSGRVVQEKSLVLTDPYDSSGCKSDQIAGDVEANNGFSARISSFVSEDSPTRPVFTDTFDIAGPCPQAATERAAKLACDLTVKDQVGRMDRQLRQPSVSIAQDTSDQDLVVRSSPPTSAAVLVSDAPPIVGARQAADNENHAQRERSERCCVFKSIAIALSVNCILIGSLLAVGVCFSGSCSRRQIESDSEAIRPTGLATPGQPIVLSTASPTEQATPVPTPLPDPELSVLLPVTVLGEALTVVGEAFPPTSQTPTRSPVAIGATLHPTQRVSYPPTPPPLRNCFDGDLKVDCHLTNGTSCFHLQPASRRQRCNLGTPLSQVEFSYHFLHCNPFGSSQQEASSCEEETRSRLAHPVNITCLDENGIASLVVYPTTIEPGQTFSVRATEGLLPEKIRCTVSDAVVSKEVQSVVVDTSGEVTLSLGDLFGGLRLESCDQTHGERLSCLADLYYGINIANNGPSVYVTNVTFSLQRVLEPDSVVTLNMTDQVKKPFPQSHSSDWAVKARVSVCTDSALRAVLAVEAVDPYKVGVYCGATNTHRIDFLPSSQSGSAIDTTDEKTATDVSGDKEAPVGHPSSIEFGPQVSTTTNNPGMLKGSKQKRRGPLVAVIIVSILAEIALAGGFYVYCKRWRNTDVPSAPKDDGEKEEAEESSMAEDR